LAPLKIDPVRHMYNGTQLRCFHAQDAQICALGPANATENQCRGTRRIFFHNNCIFCTPRLPSGSSLALR
jgi:hypothetical protein